MQQGAPRIDLKLGGANIAEVLLEPGGHVLRIAGADVDVVPGQLGHSLHRLSPIRLRRALRLPLVFPRMSRPKVLAPFSNRSFRFQWPGDLLTSCAFEMETVILGWYVLVETNSVLFLTVFGALMYVGTLIAPVLGVVSDRAGHRNLLSAMRLLYATVAALIMTLAFTGLLSPYFLCFTATITGLVRPSDIGLRGAMIADSMPPNQLTAAMSISRVTGDIARIGGPLAGAALIAAVGMGPSYVLVTAVYLAGAAMTFAAGSPARETSKAALMSSPWRDLREGVVHVWHTPSLLAIVWLAFLFNLTTFPIAPHLLAYVARDVFGTTRTGLAFLVASLSVGAIIGAFLLSHFVGNARLPKLMIVSAIIWSIFLLIFGQMQSLIGGMILLVICGILQSVTMICHAVILLRVAGTRYRGRAMGVRMMAIYSLPIGLLTAGVLVEQVGFSTTVTLFALTGLILTIATAVHWREFIMHGTGEAEDEAAA
jgi:MFS family permease